MEISDPELVYRVHVKFSKEETDMLRREGVVHPQCAEETEMDWCIDQLDFWYQWFPKEEIEAKISAALTAANLARG